MKSATWMKFSSEPTYYKQDMTQYILLNRSSVPDFSPFFIWVRCNRKWIATTTLLLQEGVIRFGCIYIWGLTGNGKKKSLLINIQIQIDSQKDSQKPRLIRNIWLKEIQINELYLCFYNICKNINIKTIFLIKRHCTYNGQSFTCVTDLGLIIKRESENSAV